MNNTKPTGLLYIKKKTPKFQIGGNILGPFGAAYHDDTLYQPQTLSSNPFENYKFDSYKKTGPIKAAGDAFLNKSTGYNDLSAKYMPSTANTTNAFGSQMKPIAPTPRITNTGFNPNPVMAAPVKGAGTQMGKFDSAGAISAVTPMIGAAGAAVSAITDNNAATFTKKEKIGAIGGSMLKGMSTGATLGSFIPVPILGTLAGAAVGAIIGGLFGRGKAKKMKKEAGKEKSNQDIAMAAEAAGLRRRETIERDALFAAATPTTAAQQQPTLSGYLSKKNGGSFHYTVKESTSPNRLRMLTPLPPKKFKRGGSITATENIIPNGVLHEEFNKLGDKGMPVVKCKNNSCEKKYEIERDEMIFTLATTKNVEKLVKSGDLKELGKYVKAQVLDNTHSFTEKFNDLNNYNKNKNESIYA